jgi:hypothetical protein
VNTPIEDRVRDLLADRTAEVSPPVDWEERVVSAGRRRRVRRRVGVIGGAVVAVVLVMFAAAVNLPQSIRGVEPVSPTGSTHAPIDPGDLPEGAATAHLHATAREGDDPATVIQGDRTWATKSMVGDLLEADGGIVASLRWDQERLVFRTDDGSEKVLEKASSAYGIAVSADGKRVAWVDLGVQSKTQLGTVRLAVLPAGQVIASMPLTTADLPGRGTPTVMGFLGTKVVLGYEEAGWPSLWDPDTRRIEPLPAETKRSRLLAVHERSGIMLFMGADGCVWPSPNNTSSAHWPSSVCGLEPASEVRISPDGRWFAGFQPDGDTVWVRDLRTGRLVWQQRFRQGLDLDGSISDRRLVSGLRLSQLAWESPDALLVTYGSPRDLDGEVADMMRCAADRPACERVPTKSGERVTRLGQ